MMKKNTIKTINLFISIFFAVTLYFFYIKYVPLVKDFQLFFLPILVTLFLLTAFKVRWGTILFIFFFPLVNNLPYFFGINDSIPHAPAALVLFLFYFLGWLIHRSFFHSELDFSFPVIHPIRLFSILVLLSGIITFFRYANFYPFVPSSVYELTTNVNGVSAGGAIMSTIFFGLNYLTGFAFFIILLHVLDSKEFMEKILTAFCLSVLLALGFGFFQHLINIRLGNTPRNIEQGLINGTLKDALSFGIFIAITFSLMLGLCLAAKGVTRFLAFLNIVLSAYLIFIAGSRSALVCFIISLLIVTVLSSSAVFNLIKEKKSPVQMRAIASLLALVLIAVMAFSFMILSPTPPKAKSLDRLKAFFEDEIGHFWLTPRGQGWKAAAHMIEDYPFTGLGLGSYIIEVANYSELHDLSIPNPQSAENYFLQVGSELGVFGIFLVLWLFREIIRQMRRSCQRLPADSPNRYILTGAIIGVISFFLNIFFHSYIGSYEIKYTFWLFVALIFILGKQEDGYRNKVQLNKSFKLSIIVVLVLFAGSLLWNSTHSLSLKSRTEQFAWRNDFGFDRVETTKDGQQFRWSKDHGGTTIRIREPVMEIPVLASHPDIKEKPVRVKIYLIKNFFKQKRLLDEIELRETGWKVFTYHIPEEINQDVILLIKVSRTWTPMKVTGTPDPRNLGVAVGQIRFRGIKDLF